MKDNPHPGISMHKIPIGGDGGGLLFVVACMVVVLLGVPSAWYFFALAVLGALPIAVVLLWLHPGIAEHRIRAGSWMWGVFFTVAALAVVLVAGSTIMYFFLLAVTGGLVVFGVLRWLGGQKASY